MNNERVTALYFIEESHKMWVTYTTSLPEEINGVNKQQYLGILVYLRNNNGTRYDLYKLLLHERQAMPCVFNISEKCTRN
ncbi:hypothetical protein TUM4444_27400 [Shewanella sp. MBTL60-112-B1]|nr:hypothetical protein TUM4444_27400 [Shewanella sp. MBTL60-112-B1]